MFDFEDPLSLPSNRDVAVDLAREGFKVFPITRKRDGSWTPIKDWQTAATEDLAAVEALWRKHPGARVGFPCGRPNEVSVLDVDVKDGKDGIASLRALGFDAKRMTPYMTRTPSGGLHLFFQANPRLKNWVGKIGEGLDVRTTGGYVLAPGSYKDGQVYESIGEPVFDPCMMPRFPEALIPDEPERVVGEVVEATERQREWAAATFAKKVAAFEALTEEGSGRNALVNELAMWAGGAAAHGMLDFNMVEAELLRAAEANGHATGGAAKRATRKTIGNGWNAGMLKPISEYPREQDESALDDLFEEEAEEEDDLLEPSAPAPVPAKNLYADLIGDDDDILGPSVPAVPDRFVNTNRQWESLLDRNEDGDTRKTLHNVEMIIMHDDRLFGRIGFNELMQCTVFVKEPGQLRKKERDGKPIRKLEGSIWQLNNRSARASGRRWEDAHTHALRSLIESPRSQGGYGITVSDRDINAAIENVSRLHSFHPIRDYLFGLKWDGVPRIDTLFIDYVGTPDTAYHRAASRLWLIGAVARVMEPGHKFDFVPILEGVQGLRKSTFVETLAVQWGAPLATDWGDNQTVTESLQGDWIYEIPELQGFSKADSTTLKAILSRNEDRARMAYGRRLQTFPRQCVFIGSTNEDEYLKDQTGNRRFWPIQTNVEQIDTDKLADNVDQIWAEAFAVYREMRRQQPAGHLPLYMRDKGAQTEALALQDSRRQESPEEVLAGEIAAALDEPVSTSLEGESVRREMTCIKEVWIDLLDRDRRDLQSQITTRLMGKAMRMAGWEPSSVAYRHPKYGVQKPFRRK
jgi:hypothetical protein